MKKSLRKVMVLGIVGVMLITGCSQEKEIEKEAKKEKLEEAQEKVEESEEPIDGFSYEEKQYGIVLTKYHGNEEKVQIPEEIDGKTVIGLDGEVFSDSEKLTCVNIPPCVENMSYDIFKKNPDLVVEGYRNTLGMELATAGRCQFENLGENPQCIKYVNIYDTQTTGVMHSVRLEDGDSGVKGEYSEGASFSIENGVAVLTLDNYQGGMIEAGGYGSLIIRLKEGSVNSIDAAEENEGIACRGSLVIEGNGSLSVKSGDDQRCVGIWVYGDLTIQDGVKLFVKGGISETQPSHSMFVQNGDIKISDSDVEIQVGKMNSNSSTIIAIVDIYQEHGKIILENCTIKEGGKIEPIMAKYQGKEYFYGQSIGKQGTINLEFEKQKFTGSAEYVRIEKGD